MLKFLRIRYFILGLVIVIALYLAAIPIKLKLAHISTPEPQAILVLGGSADREEAAAQLAYEAPNLKVWVSKGETQQESIRIFSEAGVSLSRVNLDYQASDTVTNFTTTVAQFQRRGIKHIYLVTSEFHMRRARAIAFFVLGSRGIAYTPIGVSSSINVESWPHALRDVVRALIWLMTGHTGASIGNHLGSLLQ